MPDEKQSSENTPAPLLSSLANQILKHKQPERLPALGGGSAVPSQLQPGNPTPTLPSLDNVGVLRQGGGSANLAQNNAPSATEIDVAADAGHSHALDVSEYTIDEETESVEDDTAAAPINTALVREREKQIIAQLRRELDTSRLTQISEDTQSQIRSRIRDMVNSDPSPLTMMERSVLLQSVLDEIFGFGPLGPLLRDPSIADILVNTHNSVYIERHGRLHKTPIVFENERHLRQTIEKIILPLGRRLDDNSPMVDARLPDGSRVNATIPPVTIDGPTLTIRQFGTNVMSLGQLVEKGAMSLPIAEVLKACIKGKINIIISGGTGAGKTTLLNALSANIGQRERIITIEDAAELRLQHDHWVRMETRPPNIEGKGQITQRMCVINCLRMRPDRIILGECRGEEAFDMLQAMNTGHNGSLTTIHANTPRDSTKRLENMILMSGIDMPVRSARELVSSAVQLIVQINRLEDGTRRITEVSEIAGMEGDVISLNTLFTLEREGRDARGFFKCHHVGTGLPPKFLDKLEQEAVPIKIEWFR